MQRILKSIFEAVRDKKDFVLENGLAPEVDVQNLNDEVLILITLDINEHRLVFFQGRGKDFNEALNSCLKHVFDLRQEADFRLNSIRLDIVKDIRFAKKNNPVINPKKDEIIFKNGIDGISIGHNFKAFFLPEEVLGKSLVKDKNLQVENVLDTLTHHYPINKDVAFLENIRNAKKIEVKKMQTSSFFYSQNYFRKLNNGYSVVSDVNKEVLSEAIMLTKDHYFKNCTNKKGKFIYSYLPWQDQAENRYNILRHAGTTYCILETFEFSKDKKLLDIAKSAIEFLLKKTVDFQVDGKYVNAVVEKDAIKLGGNGLLIIAIAKYIELTSDKKHLKLLQRMASWMEVIQDSEGRFSVHKQFYSTGEITGFVSHYYPGEAMLALVRLYNIDKDERWLDVAERSANYLINIRDKEANEDTIAHDHWLLYALNELYRHRPKTMYMDHALLITRAIIKTQVVGESDNVEINGAYKMPHIRLDSTPVACRSEGLCAVYKLVRDCGGDFDKDKIKEAVRQGIRFQLQMQLRKENVMFYKNKNLSLGGFQAGLNKYDLRIDYTQHNLSSLIAFYQILDEDG